MVNHILDCDRHLHYFRQRLTQVFGANLSTALLLGQRTHGKANSRSPYDVVLFIRDREDVAHDKADALQSEMLQTFDAQFNLYPFSSDAVGNDDGIMRVIRKVGVPFIETAAVNDGKAKVSERAEGVLNHNDMLCLDVQMHAIDSCLTTHKINAASVRAGTVREWSITLPTMEAISIYPDEDSEIGFGVKDHGEDKSSDPEMVQSVTALLEAVGDNKLLSSDADLASGLFDQISRIYRGRIQSLRVRSGYFDRVEDYYDAVQSIAAKINPSEPELALCRAEFHVRKVGFDMGAAPKGVRHQAEVIRHLLNIN